MDFWITGSAVTRTLWWTGGWIVGVGTEDEDEDENEEEAEAGYQ